MEALAYEQNANDSWLMLNPAEDCGSWHLSGYSPVRFSVNEAMAEPLGKDC